MKSNHFINRHQWVSIFLLCNIWFLAAVFRFSHLASLNFLVFDETYFVDFAHRYLTGQRFFDSHPPFGKYLIAFGIWVGDRLPVSHTYIDLDGALLSPWSYRWLNALVGSLIPPIVGAIAYQLTHRYRYSVIASLFALTDGLFLVESRYALINIYTIFFGLLGQLCFLSFVNTRHQNRWTLLLAAGINLGVSAAVKWNGLGFLLGIYILWFTHAFSLGFQQYRLGKHRRLLKKTDPRICSPLVLSPQSFVLFLVIIPIIVYSLSWLPHLQLNPDYGFWQVHQQLFAYHHHLGSGEIVHRYCSPWWTWPWMIRPVVYFYQTAKLSDQSTLIYAVHGMANPILSWLSIAAIGWLTYRLLQRIWIDLYTRLKNRSAIALDVVMPTSPLGIWYYLIVNYWCNWLPWILVSRCTFIYHYMSATVFAELALAFVVNSFLQTQRPYLTKGAIVAIVLIVLAFIFWLPLYLGLPLSSEAWQYRIWFPTWI